jgi:hypothetical protein
MVRLASLKRRLHGGSMSVVLDIPRRERKPA